MTLQTIFYIVGIVAMTLYTLLLIGIVILLLVIKKRIENVQKRWEEKFGLVKQIARHPREAAASVGAAVADTALNEASKLVNRNKKKRR